jgi:hypothetical protein
VWDGTGCLVIETWVYVECWNGEVRVDKVDCPEEPADEDKTSPEPTIKCCDGTVIFEDEECETEPIYCTADICMDES